MHTALVASFCCTRMASPLVTPKLSRQDILDRQDTWWRVVEHMVHNGARFYLVPALAILMAHSAADTLCMSPSGPMHMEAATWAMQ
jgi:hypothetical protein